MCPWSLMVVLAVASAALLYDGFAPGSGGAAGYGLVEKYGHSVGGSTMYR